MSADDSFSFEEEEDLSAAVVGTVSVTESRIEPSVAEHSETDSDQDQQSEEGSQVSAENSESEQSSSSSGSSGASETPQSPVSPHSPLKESLQGTVEELMQPIPLSPPKKEIPPKRKSAPRRPRKEQKPAEEPSSLPVLNRDTENKDTYDIEYILDTQKKVKGTHRFANQIDAKVPVRATDLSDRHYIRKNIEDTIRPKLSLQGSTINPEKLLPPPKPAKQQPANFVQRLYQYRDQVQEKLKQAKEQLLQDELDKCTFAPTLAKFELNRTPKQPQDFYHEGVVKARENKQKAADLRREMTAEPSSFRPEIDAHSLKLLEKKGRSQKPVHDKLYRSIRSTVTRQITEGQFLHSKSLEKGRDLTFKPTINPKSEEMVKEKRGNLQLYEEALKKSSKPISDVKQYQPKLLSKHSEKMLQAKFEEELKTAWNQAGASEAISLEQLEKCLEALGLRPRTGLDQPVKDIWEALEGETRGGVKMQALQTFLKAILRFRAGIKVIPDNKETARFGSYKDDNFIFTDKQLKRAQVHFRCLFEAQSSLIKLSSPDHFRSLESFSFHPEILTSFASQRSSMTSLVCVETRLMAEKQRKLEKLEKIRAAVHSQQMAECTFTPSLRKHQLPANHSMIIQGSDDSMSETIDRNSALYRFAEVCKARKDVFTTQELSRSYALSDDEKYVEECPFYPNLDIAG